MPTTIHDLPLEIISHVLQHLQARDVVVFQAAFPSPTFPALHQWPRHIWMTTLLRNVEWHLNRPFSATYFDDVMGAMAAIKATYNRPPTAGCAFPLSHIIIRYSVYDVYENDDIAAGRVRATVFRSTKKISRGIRVLVQRVEGLYINYKAIVHDYYTLPMWRLLPPSIVVDAVARPHWNVPFMCRMDMTWRSERGCLPRMSVAVDIDGRVTETDIKEVVHYVAGFAKLLGAKHDMRSDVFRLVKLVPAVGSAGIISNNAERKETVTYRYIVRGIQLTFHLTY